MGHQKLVALQQHWACPSSEQGIPSLLFYTMGGKSGAEGDPCDWCRAELSRPRRGCWEAGPLQSHHSHAWGCQGPPGKAPGPPVFLSLGTGWGQGPSSLGKHWKVGHGELRAQERRVGDFHSSPLRLRPGHMKTSLPLQRATTSSCSLGLLFFLMFQSRSLLFPHLRSALCCHGDQEPAAWLPPSQPLPADAETRPKSWHFLCHLA